MSKRFTYLLAGMVAVAAVTPTTVSAQQLLNSPQRLTRSTGMFTPEGKPVIKKALKTKAPARTKAKASTDVFQVPYLQEFDTEDAFNTFTVIDANNDTRSWEYNANNKVAFYHYSGDNTGDDWLITPSIQLRAGRIYTVAFKARSYFGSFQERIEAKWGQGTTVADMTDELVPSTDLTGNNWHVLTKEIIPAADGTYNFGFHAISDKDQYFLYLDSISITQSADLSAPDSVTNFNAVADPTGALKVTLSFNAPAKTISGDDLSSIDSIIVSKNNAYLGSIKPATPGAAYTFVDNNATNGTNNYSVVAVNGEGEGRKALKTVEAGVDIPAKPEVKAVDNQTSVTLSWPTVKGANGGVIVPSDVYYDIVNVTSDGYLADTLTTLKGANEYTIQMNTTEGEQDYAEWAISARNSAGKSGNADAYIIKGAPYTLPYANSLAGATTENQFFRLFGTQTVRWALASDNSADNDGGSLVFRNSSYYYYYPGQSLVSTGKINLSGAQNPKLIFSYNGSKSKNARLVVEVETPDGVADSLWSENFTSGSDTWHTVSVNLPATVANEPYVFVNFRGVANDNTEAVIYVDDIHVVDPYQNDAAISVTAPATLQKGQSANIVATLSNQGVDDLSNLEVKISVNDEVIADTTIAKSLAILDEVQIPVTYKTSSTKSTTSLNVKAEVINANDLDESNNTATASVVLSQADVNAPEGLQGTLSGDSVKLSWAAPGESSTTVTDDFESYNAWDVDEAGDWTFVNGNGTAFGTLTEESVEPNVGANAAYEIWRPSDVFAEGQGLDPHSGVQCLASVYKTGYKDADEWAISPELSGKAQTVTFWVNNILSYDRNDNPFGREKFQVLTSTTANDTASFTQIGDDYEQTSATWTQISVDLPAGTKYFAIRRITATDEQLLFLVDDVTYEKNEGVVSYNIYVDGTYAGNTTGTSYDAGNEGANHSYSVTAVYADGSESEPATIDLVANSIDDIHAQLNADKYDVYTIGGAQVKLGAKSLNGLTPGVYVINGKKVLLK